MGLCAGFYYPERRNTPKRSRNGNGRGTSQHLFPLRRVEGTSEVRSEIGKACVDDELNQLQRELSLEPLSPEKAQRLLRLYERRNILLHFENPETISQFEKFGVQLARPIEEWRRELTSDSLPSRYDAVRSLLKLGPALLAILPELIEAFNVKHSENAYRLAFYRAFSKVGEGIVDFLPVIMKRFDDYSKSEDMRIELTAIFQNAGTAIEPFLIELAQGKNRYQRVDALRLLSQLQFKTKETLRCLDENSKSRTYVVCLAAVISRYELTRERGSLIPELTRLFRVMSPLVFDRATVEVMKELGAEVWPAVEAIVDHDGRCPRFVRRMIIDELRQIDFGSPENNEKFQSFCAADFLR